MAWLIVADGDASLSLRKAFRDADEEWPERLRQLAQEVSQAKSLGGDEWRGSLARFNQATGPPKGQPVRRFRVPVKLLDVDLESAILAQASKATTRRLSEALGWETSNRFQLMGWLGSKAPEKIGAEKDKYPFRRAILGSLVLLSETSSGLQETLFHWLRNAGTTERRAREMISRA